MITELTKEKLTMKLLENFLDKHKGLIIRVSAEEARKGQEKLKKLMEEDPIGKQILNETNEQMKRLEETAKKE